VTRASRALGASVVFAALASGCAPHGATSNASDRALRVIVQADIPTLNSAINDSPATGYIDQLVMSYLLRADPAGNPIPDLAVRVPTVANGDLSRDGKTIVYHLRRGVRWHDGVPFTARDVVFSFAFVRDPRSNVPDRSEYDAVERVDAPDDATVRVRLKAPSSSAVPTFFAMTANDPYPILPAHVAELARDPNRAAFNAAPIGTGPFVFREWRRGDRVVVSANPQYYGGAPRISRLEIVTLPNPQSYDLAIATGDADIAYEAVVNGRIAPDPARFRVAATAVNESVFVQFDIAKGPMRDERLRHAVVAAIDAATVARTTIPRDGYRLVASDRLPGAIGYDPTLRRPPYDPTAAARMLDAAGYRLAGSTRLAPDGSPLSIELVTTVDPANQRTATLLQQQLRRVGLTSNIHAYPYASYYDSYADGGVLERGRFDLALSGWSYGGVDDHSYLYRCASRPPAGENYGGICDPEIERLATIARASTDPSARAAADAGISKRLVDRAYLDVLFFDAYRTIAKRDVIGPIPTRLNQPLANAASWRFR
jgi:peptide/nickel transport system substrate-binding protein